MVEIDVPYPPSANHLWTRTRKGMRKTDIYKAWLTEAGWLAKSAGRAPIKGPYKLTIQATRPDKRRRDLDNLIKPISDLLVSVGIIADDCACEMISARWVTVGEGITVRVESAATEAA